MTAGPVELTSEWLEAASAAQPVRGAHGVGGPVLCGGSSVPRGGVVIAGDVGQGGSGEEGGTRGVALRASGAESLDWWSCEARQLVDAGTGGSAVDSNHRVEIQQEQWW
ncbi:hypothetical protein NDU88_005612 [Pleurodeles waltl]|uniref:Uncharacterized protein n=1 Tax=Pleurodeles waltl TaxID=8319 RepID=A0AAV7VN44_PLEWA|nr:hypothetical protein NDU88_005612 [Pleurodeles waltl]